MDRRVWKSVIHCFPHYLGGFFPQLTEAAELIFRVFKVEDYKKFTTFENLQLNLISSASRKISVEIICNHINKQERVKSGNWGH